MHKLRLILLAVLVLLIAGGVVYYQLSPPARLALKLSTARQAPGSVLGSEPQAKEITYNHVEDGRRKWSLTADSGEYEPASGNIALQKVRITFYQENGGQMYVEGDEGRYDQADQVVVLTGNVFGRNHQDVTIRTSKLVYIEAQRMMTTDQEVTVSGPAFSIISLGMQAFIDPQSVVFERQVDSIFWPDKQARQDSREQSSLASND